MPSRDIPELVGLQLWLPSDSFNAAYNVSAFQKTISNFQALNILNRPEDSSIYCAGENRYIYHVVGDSDVHELAADLRRQPTAVTASLQPDQRVDSNDKELLEESRVRALHLALGRTGLHLAIEAEDSGTFTAATHDVKQVFSMLRQPIHSLDVLTDTPLHEGGLLYMFVLAARKHKSLTPQAAAELMETLNQGILPFENGQTWAQERGKSFVDRIGFVPKKVVYPKQERLARQKRRGRQERSKSAIPVVRLTPEQPVKQTAAAQAFIARLLKERPTTSYEDSLETTYDRFLGKKAEPFEIPDNLKVEVGKMGVEGYLETMRVRANDAADQMLRYVHKRRSNYKFGLLPLVVLGNYVTAKVNKRGGVEGEPMELPSLSIQGLGLGFHAIRYALKDIGFKEDANDQKLGNIVEAYLQSVFSSSDEQNYEVADAPEGMVRASHFAVTQGISQAVLDMAIGEYGIDAGNYKFGPLITKGLTLAEQEMLKSIIDEIKVEPAPQGYRSISGFAVVTGVTKPRVDKLIEKYGIETGRHGFRGRTATSLSPEAQDQLAEIINQNRRKRRGS